ncbi:signal peptidase I [Streptosporangium sp. KLBMP 9127]|nr:signal peptidase I [Streptosporangium sp. KLBMP 9127]
MRIRGHRVLVAGALAAAGLAAGIVWARRTLVLATVEGSSMEPTLRAGDRVLVRKRGLADVRHGDLVVLMPPPEQVIRRRPAPRWNIKRVVALPGDPVPAAVAHIEGVSRVPHDALVVYGDSPASADSRQRGFFASDRLLGVVVRQLPARTPPA